jgi:outer membrane protein assembly factor BamB
VKRILLAVAAMTAAAAICWSQNNVASPAPSDAKPASTNAPGREYPKVDSQRRATFRVNAPNAKTVRVFNTDLKKGDDGYWTGTTRRQNQRGIVGAVTLIPGALLSGARDGMVRAVSSRTGQLLWEFDTAREFTTVNGVPAKGGSAASGGPIVANGMVFIGSGYPGFQNGQPGNVLLAFAPAVRLDVFAYESKNKTDLAK